MTFSNRMTRQLAPIERLPAPLQRTARSWALRRAVPFTGTARLVYEEVTPGRVVVSIANRRPVQNHIHGVHATAMALLAETATGFVVGMNLPDDKLPLLKSMQIDYVKRAEGGLRASARLSEEQTEALRSQPKGDVEVAVIVTDSAGVEPIRCRMVWAWIERERR